MNTTVNINGVDVEVEAQKSSIYGLKFLPRMVRYDNDADRVFDFYVQEDIEVSDGNFNLVDSLAKDYCTDGIMEIGIHRNGSRSFTMAMLKNKPDSVPYLGIDIDDRSYLDNPEKNIYTLKENSFSQEAVRNYAEKIGLKKVSILFIDGWHSLNACINDWKYADMLSDKAIVVFHDTNHHPGPTIILHAIDETKFRVEKYFVGKRDFGVSVAYKQ